jgi:hypothetical protein
MLRVQCESRARRCAVHERQGLETAVYSKYRQMVSCAKGRRLCQQRATSTVPPHLPQNNHVNRHLDHCTDCKLRRSVSEDVVTRLERVAREHARHHGYAHALGRLRQEVALHLRNELNRFDEHRCKAQQLDVELVVEKQPGDTPQTDLVLVRPRERNVCVCVSTQKKVVEQSVCERKAIGCCTHAGFTSV